MTDKKETPIKPSTPRTPDGVFTTKTNNQTFIIKVFFNSDSKMNFQDKLLRVMLSERRLEPINSNPQI